MCFLISVSIHGYSNEFRLRSDRHDHNVLLEPRLRSQPTIIKAPAAGRLRRRGESVRVLSISAAAILPMHLQVDSVGDATHRPVAPGHLENARGTPPNAL